MSIPPDPPPDPRDEPWVPPPTGPPGQPFQPYQPYPPYPPPVTTPPNNRPSKKAPLQGALAAVVVVVLLSLMVTLRAGWATLVFAPFFAVLCVFLGSFLTIPTRTRRFATGFLITSAILIFVTAGVCVVVTLATTRPGQA